MIKLDIETAEDKNYYDLWQSDRRLSGWTPGDINGDGNVDNKDIVTLFRYVSGYPVVVLISALDPNGDGNVDNKDIVTLFRYVSGGDVKLSDKLYIPEE